MRGVVSGAWYGSRRFTEARAADSSLQLLLNDTTPRFEMRKWRGLAAARDGAVG